MSYQVKIENRHVAWYGNIAVDRAYCVDCKRFAFIRGGKIQCCDSDVPPERSTEQCRLSEAPGKRRRPGRDEQWKILKEQNYKCLYCLRAFGSTVWRGRKQKVIRVNWDHLIPYSYSQNNYAYNFVAVCQICNDIKASWMFESIEEIRIYVRKRAKEKGYSTVPHVLGEFHPEKTLAKILHS